MASPRLGDALKLGTPGRIHLGDGETVIGSGKLDAGAGAVRWVLTNHQGHTTVRVGVGSQGFGGRHDEAGPWTADRDHTAALNAGRGELRAEARQIEARLEEIDAAERCAGQSYADLAADAAAAQARLDEIHEFDRRKTRAVQRYQYGDDYDGQPTCEEDQWLTGYCAPGEFDALKARRNRLHGVAEPPDDAGPDWPRPAGTGEREQLEARYAELDDMETGEVYASGYTARVDLASLDQLRSDVAPAIAAAREYGGRLADYWDERDRLEAGDDLDALDAHLATPEPEPPAGFDADKWGAGVMGSGVVRGAWGDLHWEVEFDETASLRLGVVPHGQTEVANLSDLADQELTARLSLGLPLAGYNDTDEVAALLKQLDRVSAAGHAAQAAGGASSGYAGRRRAAPDLSPAWAAAVDAWVEALAQELPAEGAIEEIDAYFRGFAGACRQIGEAVCEQAAELYGSPLVGRLLDHMYQAGEGWAAIADEGDALVAAWVEEHAEALRRQREPRPHEGMLNVT